MSARDPDITGGLMLGNQRRNRFWSRLKVNLVRDRVLILMMLPVIAYFILFHYTPMAGVLIAFQRFKPGSGFFSGEWVGFQYFIEFFESIYFTRLVRNTLLISLYSLLWGFPLPILFALMLNEIRRVKFKRFIQTVSYLPHFISVVIVVGMMFNLFSTQGGVVNVILARIGIDPINFMTGSRYFRSMYIGSGIWQGFGWSSIIYLAALSSIDVEQYEAARIDGANKFKQLIYVTLPGIRSTVVLLLILSLGNIMNVGFEKIILMYSPATYEVSDVISTYVFRRGIQSAQYSFGAAVGLFNSVINFSLLIFVNKISKSVSEISLW